jgi:hypothetical protein
MTHIMQGGKVTKLWIRGGEPIETSFLVGQPDYEVEYHDWQELGRVIGPGGEVSVQFTRTKKSPDCSVQLAGYIDGAAPGTQGAMGWTQSTCDTVSVSAGLASIWSAKWLAWRHGKLGNEELVASLGSAGDDDSAHGAIRFQVPSPARRADLVWWTVGSACAGLACGLFLGWWIPRKCDHGSRIHPQQVIERDAASKPTGEER